MTPQEIQRLLTELQRAYDRLGDTNPFRNFDTSNIQDAAATARQLEESLRGVQTRLRYADESLSDLAGAFKAIVGEITKSNTELSATTKTFRSLTSLSTKLRNDQTGISTLNKKDLISIKEKIEAQRQELVDNQTLLRNKISQLQQQNASQELIDKHIDALNAVNEELGQGDTLYKSLLKAANERLELEERIEKSLGITGGLLKGIEGSMNKIGLGALSSAIGFNEINDELKQYARELEKSDNNLSEAEKKQMVMNKGFELLGKSVRGALGDPLVTASLLLSAISTLAGKIAEGFQRSQENTGALAKGLNITNGEAMQLSKSFSQASFGSDRLFVSSKGLTETLVAINSELGTTVQLSAEELLTFTKLRETAGLTNEELMGIQSLSLANGESFDKNADSILNQVSALNRASGIYLNEKEVLKDISKLSAATTLSLGKNPTALAEAVATAKSLGIEMSKLEGVADSLLDFESSITAELEAELLLGKDLNLEKARQAALNNDLATLAREIADQAGSAAEFGEMNRIQQEAIAKYVGMNREDLAQTLFVQEQLVGVSGEEAERRQKLLDTRIEEVGLAQAQRELEENGLQNMLDQATAAEKMRASQEKINELFTALGAMLAPAVDIFASIAGALMESKAAMVGLSIVVGGLIGVLTALAAKSVATAISAIFSGSAMLGPFGIPVAIAGVASLIGAIAAGASAVSAVGDVMSPSSGKTMVSTKEGGLYELSKNDDLVAAPGAIDRMKNGGSTTVVNQTPPPPPPPDNTETKRTNQLLERLINQPAVFKIGTDEFFTSTSKYSYEIQ
jgi:hypothetical protein